VPSQGPKLCEFARLARSEPLWMLVGVLIRGLTPVGCRLG